jgi:integrase
VIATDLSTDRSRFAFVADVRAVYSWLEREGYIAFNPLSNIEAEYDWDRSEPDNTALEPAEISTLLDTATTEARELLVVALAGWGLRPSEVAALHVSQFVLEGDDPHIAFEDRKNGPGTVALLVGRTGVDDRLDTLAIDTEDWNGYLFPSSASDNGHVVADTIRNWFTDLTATADVTIDGSPATPKTARRFWYSAYSRAHVQLMDDMDQIADEQGAESGRVVWENYLSEADRRRRRRQEMQQELVAVFR